MHRSAQRLAIKLPALLLCMALTACVAPRVVEHYDADCHIVTRHMELATGVASRIDKCRDTSDCITQLVAIGVVGAASVVISGSIVVAGNVVFWMEKQGRCQREPASASSSSSSASAATT